MSDLNIEATFDWEVFVDKYWKRSPVLYKSVADPPFDEAEVFSAAVNSGSRSQSTQLTIEQFQQDSSTGYLPNADDADFDGYVDRMAKSLDGRRYALIVNGFHAFDFAMWCRERDFYAGLWRHVGLPLTSAITTMFHGNYDHSPVGVHKDRFATFMFGLRGAKRMRFWPQRPWTSDVSTVVDYDEFLPQSFVAEVFPGDLLYWPSDYYHVGESGGGAAATSINVGVPITEHRSIYELQRFYMDYTVDLLVSGALTDELPAVQSAMTVPDIDIDATLASPTPPAITEASTALANRLVPPQFALRSAEVSLNCLTAGGFEPVPSPRAVATLEDNAQLCVASNSPIRWHDAGADCRVCGVNGHTMTTMVDGADLQNIVAALATGPVTVGTILAQFSESRVEDAGAPVSANREGVRRLLEAWESFGAIYRLDSLPLVT